uniref:CHASE2 domain-containing protein n=1 Tax=Phenylobacterium sp. TaxID=1871053 RepID=UPI002FDA51AF
MAPAAARHVRLEWWLTAFLILTVSAWLSLSGAAGRLDAMVYDGLMRRAQAPADGQVVIVAIDDLSIAEVGPWPWPRSVHAALTTQLAAANPKVLAYDILFPEPSADPAADEAFAEALRNMGAAVLPLHLEAPGPDGAAYWVRPPTPPLAQAAAGLGHVNLQFDADGVVRRASLVERIDGRDIPHLALAAERVAQGLSHPIPPPAGPADHLERSPPVLIPFKGPPGHFPTLPASQVLRGEAPDAFLRDRHVLVGVTASGLGDRYATPLSRSADLMSGVEIIGHILAGELHGQALQPLSPAGRLAFGWAPVLIMLLALRRLKPQAVMLLAAGLVILVLASSLLLMVTARLWAPPSGGLLSLVLLMPVWAWRRLAAASRYLNQELERFAQTPDLLTPVAASRGGDRISRQMDALETAIGRAEALRKLIFDALQSLPDAAFLLDQDGRVTFANSRGHDLLPNAMGADFQGLIEAWRRPDSETEEDGETVERHAPDGRIFQIDTRPLTEAAGPARHLVRLVDITPLRAAAAQRERVVQLLTHDMRSPQVSILALLRTHPDLATLPVAQRIETYANQTLALADSFVQLARAEADEMDLEPLDLGDLLTEVADELWPQAQARGLRILVETPEAAPITGDRTLLSRALANLLGNALKHSPDGQPVEASVRVEGETVVCEIADRGPGLPVQALERIFQPFQRLPETGTTAGGSGLGLVIVAEVARRHGGAAGAAQRPGGGAVFSLSLPRAAGPP